MNIDDQVWKHVYVPHKTFRQIRNQVQHLVRGEVYDRVEKQIYDRVWGQVQSQVSNQLDDDNEHR